MKWNVGRKIAGGFGAVLVIFVVVGAVSYHGIDRLNAVSESRRQSFELLRELGDTLSLLKDVEVGQRGFVITGDSSYLEPYELAVAGIDEHLRRIRLRTEGGPHQQRFAALEPLIKTRMAHATQTVETRRREGMEAAVRGIASGEGKKLMDRIRDAIAAVNTEEERLLAMLVDRVDSEVRYVKATIAVGTIAASLLAMLVGYLLTRTIAQPLQKLTAVAERITVGDLGVEVKVDGRSDEVGVLARAFVRMTHALNRMAGTAEQIAAGDLRAGVEPQSPNDVLGHAFARMTADLREQMRQLVEGASIVASSASQIVASTAQLAAGASQSAAAVSQTTTTVEEVRQTAQLASRKAEQVSESSQHAAQSAHGGQQATDDVAAGMASIREQMEAIAASMARLHEQTRAIGEIIASVDDLAAQSNLLAVNAAIEAAKAGEHGKGFSVVAREVKSLAEQSRQATRQVRSLLDAIQKATEAAVAATEEGSEAVETGTHRTETAGQAIRALAASVDDAAQSALQIAASSRQQMIGVEQVAGAMQSIKQATEQNVASAQQMESAARDLNRVGQRLQQIVSRYRLEIESRDAA